MAAATAPKAQALELLPVPAERRQVLPQSRLPARPVAPAAVVVEQVAASPQLAEAEVVVAAAPAAELRVASRCLRYSELFLLDQ